MIGNRGILVLKITFVVSVLNFSFWSWIKDYTGLQTYYVGNAISYTGYTYVLYEYARAMYRKRKEFSSLLTWSEVILAASINNLLDELFFDPQKLSWNEYLAFIIIIAIAVYNEKRRNKKNSTGIDR